MQLLPDYEVLIDADVETLIRTLHGRWYLGGRRKQTPFTALTVADRELLGPNTPKQVTLSQLVSWRNTNRWLTREDGDLMRLGEANDYRFATLELRSPDDRAKRLRAVTPPPAPDKGITQLPGGQFKVRAYDPKTKKSTYIGLRDTKEEAIELKRAFLAGEAKFGGDRAKPRFSWPASIPAEDTQTLLNESFPPS